MKHVRPAELWKWHNNRRKSYRKAPAPMEVETDRNIGLTFRTNAARNDYDKFYGSVVRWRRIRPVSLGA